MTIHVNNNADKAPKYKATSKVLLYYYGFVFSLCEPVHLQLAVTTSRAFGGTLSFRVHMENYKQCKCSPVAWPCRGDKSTKKTKTAVKRNPQEIHWIPGHTKEWSTWDQKQTHSCCYINWLLFTLSSLTREAIFHNCLLEFPADPAESVN